MPVKRTRKLGSSMPKVSPNIPETITFDGKRFQLFGLAKTRSAINNRIRMAQKEGQAVRTAKFGNVTAIFARKL